MVHSDAASFHKLQVMGHELQLLMNIHPYNVYGNQCECI